MFGAEMKEAATHQSTMFITLQIREIVGPWIIRSTVQIHARSSTHLIVYDAHRDMDVAVQKNFVHETCSIGYYILPSLIF